MKVILYAAITVNGYISSREDDTSWISEEEWKNFRSFAKKVEMSLLEDELMI